MRVRYTGNKAKLLTRYAPFFAGLRPEYCVDYFGGSGTMSLWFHELYPEAKLYLNDKDPAIYKLFKCIQQEYEEFMEWLEVIDYDYRARNGSENKKAYYYSSRNQDYNPTQYLPYEKISHEKWFRSYFKDLSEERIQMQLSRFGGDWDMTKEEIEDLHGKNTPLEHAFYFLLRKFSFSGVNMRNKKGEYTSSAGIRSPNQPCYDPEALAAFKAMLEHAELLNKDYRDVDIQLPRVLHYFDPPYVGTGKSLYMAHFGWEQTEALCEYVQRVSEHSTVFMSNSDHPRLKTLMKGFNWYSFPTVGGMHNKINKEPVRETLFYKIHPSIAG